MSFAKDTEFWMTNLPQKLRLLPVIHLAIPGSHDSTTYAITKKSNISPDARCLIQYLKFLEPILRPILLKWSRTQSVDVMQQLLCGIRYFDLRISTKPGSCDFYFVHNMYSEAVKGALTDVNRFLDEHPKEIVILDCQHFYNMYSSDHQRFTSLLKSIFGQKLLPYSKDMMYLTLDYMSNNSKQVFLIYRNCSEVIDESFWPLECFPTPWPDTVFIPKLISFLDQGIKNRKPVVGFVSQCVLTPTVWYAFKHIFSSLINKCVLPLEVEKYDWIRRQRAGRGGVNIIISDFINFQDYQFSKEVINLNYKLLVNDKSFH